MISKTVKDTHPTHRAVTLNGYSQVISCQRLDECTIRIDLFLPKLYSCLHNRQGYLLSTSHQVDIHNGFCSRTIGINDMITNSIELNDVHHVTRIVQLFDV